MDPTPCIDEFRAEVRAYIRTHLPVELRKLVEAERMDIPKELQRHWHRRLQVKNWGCPGWPGEYGGPGWSDRQQYVFEREIALADAPRPMVYGTGMLGPTIMEFGTEEQKREILPRIRNADDFWCQGYSEPGAGSDLASLQCRAIRDGGNYVINGTKMWTSEAHIADRMFGLFRTDSSGKKQYGITFLLLDMNTEGIDVHPIKTYDGAGPEINQVFFKDVRVPVQNRVGEENQGWGIAKYLLSLERFGTAEVSRSLRTLERLKQFVHSIGKSNPSQADQGDIGYRLNQCEIELRALELTEYRLLFGSEPAGAEASLLKLRGTEIQNRILELFHDITGEYALIDSSDPDSVAHLPDSLPQAGFIARAHFNFRKTEIYAGSSEIQKNIIAKAVLGL